MVKVCHMTSAHDPEDVRIFYKECTSLAKAGYEVYLVERGATYEKNGVHIIGVGQPAGGRLNRMTGFAKKVYETALAVDADVYHFHDPELLPWGLKLKRKGKKVIFDSHELYALQLQHKSYLPSLLSKVIAKLYVPYERFVVKKLDGVIFPCLVQGKNPFDGKCSRLAIIDNVPLLEEFEEGGECSPKAVFSACYVGGIRADRGIMQDVLACNQAEVPLQLGGLPSSSEFQQQLESADEKHLVEFRGQLDRAQVSALLHDSSVGLVTELNVGQNNQLDNLPTKTYEYMATGLPVIISRSKYVASLLAHYPFGISVDPESVDEIAGAIRYLLDHPEEACRMGENGRRAVKEQFNWGVEEKKLLALYEDILKQ